MKRFNKIIYLNFLVLLIAFISACGNKGPLYIPQPTEQTNNTDTGAQ